MTKFISWLKSLFIKKETTQMTDQVVDTQASTSVVDDAATAPVAADTSAVVAEPVAVAPVTDVTDAEEPAAADTSVQADTTVAKDGVNDLEAALKFIEEGLEHLGQEAKAELVALAKKYL